MSKTVRFIFLLNIYFFILNVYLKSIGFNINSILALYPISHSNFQFFELFTYMFSHFDLSHLVMNMLFLILIGPKLEEKIGSLQFLKLYLISGVAGGLAHAYFSSTSVIGASGAVWGVLFTFVLVFRHEKIRFFQIINVSIIIWILFTVELLLLFENDRVSHIGHVFGALSGLLYYNNFLYKRNI